MLFQNIAALVAKGVTLSFHVSQADDGKLEVGVIPSTTSGASGLDLVAKSFVATPAELDLEFAAVIADYAKTNMTLQEQLMEVKVKADVAAEEARAEAAKKTVKPAAGRKVAGSGSKLNVDAGDDDNDDDLPGDGGETDLSTSASDLGSTQTPMPFTL